jgi:hypothetical protein
MVLGIGFPLGFAHREPRFRVWQVVAKLARRAGDDAAITSFRSH